MPAKLDLLPCKEFTITLSDGTVIKGQFGTWATKRLCDKHKLTYGQLASMQIGDYSMAHVVDMILCAVEHSARKAKAPFSYDDVNACEWIDEMGGIGSDMFGRLFGHQVSEFELPAAPEEKKTETQPGPISPVSSMQPVEA